MPPNRMNFDRGRAAQFYSAPRRESKEILVVWIWTRKIAIFLRKLKTEVDIWVNPAHQFLTVQMQSMNFQNQCLSLSDFPTWRGCYLFAPVDRFSGFESQLPFERAYLWCQAIWKFLDSSKENPWRTLTNREDRKSEQIFVNNVNVAETSDPKCTTKKSTFHHSSQEIFRGLYKPVHDGAIVLQCWCFPKALEWPLINEMSFFPASSVKTWEHLSLKIICTNQYKGRQQVRQYKVTSFDSWMLGEF